MFKEDINMIYGSYNQPYLWNTAKINGKGSIKVKPNIAIVTLGVSTEGKELKNIQEENALRASKVAGTLKRLGIREEDIQTQNYNIDIQYDYIEGKEIFKGYRVRNILKVIVRDIDRVGQVIDEAVEDGANIVSHIRFTVSDESIYYNRALRHAIEDSIEKQKL